MASGISVSGLMSGLDTATIVQQLMSIERQPVYQLENRLTLATTRQEAYRDVNTKLLSLMTAAEALTGDGAFTENSASSSDEAAITASATDNTPEGVYSFAVTQLAQTSQVTSDGQAVGYVMAGAGTIDIDIDGAFAGSAAFNAGDTLQDIADAVNALGIDATASVLNDGTDERLIVTSKDSGAAGQLTVTDSTAALNFSDLTVGQDAEIEFGADSPITITSSTNTFSGVLEGLSFTVHRETDPGAFFPPSPAETVTITVGAETTGVVDAVQEFVDSYNEAIGRIDDLYTYDLDSEKSALLQGDTTLRFIKQDLTTFISAEVPGLPAGLNSLFQLGVTVDSQGVLNLDEDVLQAEIANDPNAVSNVFGADPGGIARLYADRLGYITDDFDGQIQMAIDYQDDLITNYQDQIDRLEALLEIRESRLAEEFLRMEQALAQLQTQSAFFAQQLGTSGGGINSLLG